MAILKKRLSIFRNLLFPPKQPPCSWRKGKWEMQCTKNNPLYSSPMAKSCWLFSLWVCHKQTVDGALTSSTLRRRRSPIKARIELSPPHPTSYIHAIEEDVDLKVSLSSQLFLDVVYNHFMIIVFTVILWLAGEEESGTCELWSLQPRETKYSFLSSSWNGIVILAFSPRTISQL